MKTKLIQIGNSRGVRIPKPFIEESGLTEDIEMVLREGEIVLRSAKKVRKGWEEAFERMAEQEDDVLLDRESIEKSGDWDETEWKW